jgi:hypothetical protein
MKHKGSLPCSEAIANFHSLKPNYFGPQTHMLFLVDTFYGAFANLRKATVTSVTPVCPSVRSFVWKDPAPTGRISTKIGI